MCLFFLQKQGEFAEKLSVLRREQREKLNLVAYASPSLSGSVDIAALSKPPSSLSKAEKNAIRELSEGYRAVGDDLIRLVHFVELNATGLRKILKKHDKNINDRKITGQYISSRVDNDSDSHLQQLYHYEGIAAIVTTLRTALRELRILEVMWSLF